jgi:hypothetical protein
MQTERLKQQETCEKLRDALRANIEEKRKTEQARHADIVFAEKQEQEHASSMQAMKAKFEKQERAMQTRFELQEKSNQVAHMLPY